MMNYSIYNCPMSSTAQSPTQPSAAQYSQVQPRAQHSPWPSTASPGLSTAHGPAQPRAQAVSVWLKPDSVNVAKLHNCANSINTMLKTRTFFYKFKTFSVYGSHTPNLSYLV